MIHATCAELRFHYAFGAAPAGAAAEPLADAHGDHAIVNLVLPLLRRLREAGLVQRCDWLRYAIGGVHLRVHLRTRGTAPELSAFGPGVDLAVARYLLEHAPRLTAPGELGAEALRLHQRLGVPVECGLPGAHALLLSNESLQAYDDDQAREDALAMLDLLSTAQGALLETAPNMATRKAWVRLLLVDLLLEAGLDAAEVFYALEMARQTWIAFFSIAPQELARRADQCARLQPTFERFLGNRRSPGDSTAALPPLLRQPYLALVRDLMPLMRRLMRRDAAEGLSVRSVVQIVNLVHLCHNRVALDLGQELLFADLMCAVFATRLPPHAAQALRAEATAKAAAFAPQLDHPEPQSAADTARRLTPTTSPTVRRSTT